MNLDITVSCIIIMAVICGIGMIVSNYNDGDMPIHGMLSVWFDVPERLANVMASVDGSDVVEVAKWGIILITGHTSPLCHVGFYLQRYSFDV